MIKSPAHRRIAASATGSGQAGLDARLTIDLDALAANHAQLKADCPGAEVAPVVKADGYGLGAGPVSRRLHAEGARRFFVARLVEGEALRRELGERDAIILVLDGLSTGRAERMAASHLSPVLNSLEEIDAWAGMGERAGPCALHIDTGMNRIGLPTEAVGEAAARITAGGLNLDIVMSHLAAAGTPEDPRNDRQRALFDEVRTAFPGVRSSLVASAGIYLDPACHYDLVRPGICLYGGGPRDAPDPRFKSVVTLEAPVLQIIELRGGESSGYGTMFRAARDMRLALLGAGYADGMLRGAHASGYAWAAGRRVNYCIVTMDMIGVDVTEAPEVRIGDLAEILGPHAELDAVARAGGTVAHEFLVRLSRRIERTYRGAR
jgi:alanine racemase